MAAFFQNLGDFTSAIKFLVISGCTADALALAVSHNKMEIYGEVVGDSASDTDFATMAAHFEKKGDNYEAGRYYMKANDYVKVRSFFVRCSESFLS